MTPIKDRSDEELNRTIAEWEGWMFIPSRDIYISGQLQAVPEEWESPDGNYRDASPNYTSDLNACHEAKKKLLGCSTGWVDFALALMNVLHAANMSAASSAT